MSHKKFHLKLLFKIALLFIALCAASILASLHYWVYAVILLPLVAFLVYDLWKFITRVQNEVTGFLEMIHYRDFSRRFHEADAPFELRPLRNGFNEITSVLKEISREKEIQYQYLQKILELIGTGILSYEMDSGKVIWINESLKSLLQIPYLRSVNSLERKYGELYQTILPLQPGDSVILNLKQQPVTSKILLSATAFNTDGHRFKLIAFQNIDDAINATETDAWKKLLSVMTHEIMNSVVPISSLADTLNRRFAESASLLNDEAGILNDFKEGIDTIKHRSEGLLRFTQTYRSLNKTIIPNLQTVLIRYLFETMDRLMQPTLQQYNIQLDIFLKDPGLHLKADPGLIEQVLINLILNAIEAIRERPVPRIALLGETLHNRQIAIKVSDNGQGMDENVMENIFTPFFSTKKNGNGIGLSLCRQIMMAHKGSIHVQSVPGEGSVFTLLF